MKRLLLFGLLFAASGAAPAADLLDVFRQALERDASWAAARAAYRAGIERAPQGLAQLLPTLGLSAATTETDLALKTPTVNNTFNYRTDSYSLTLTQPLYRKQNLAEYAKGQSGAAQAELDLAGARQDLALRAAQAYFGVLAAQEAHETAVAEKEAVGKLLALARRNFAVGVATRIDVHEAEARYDTAQAQEIAAASELEVRREALRAIVGEAPTALAPLVARLELGVPEPADAERWAATAQEGPRVKSQEQAVAIAREEFEKSRGGHYPTLDLTAARTYTDAGGSTFGTPVESTANQVGLLFQMPLYQGGNVSSKVRETAARLDEAEQRLDQARRQAAQQAREAYLAVTSGAARARAIERAHASNQRALESTVLGYERGVRTGVDVLNSQRELFRARRDLSQSRYDYLVSRLRLKAAAGILTEQDLEDTNRLLAQH